jgi:hypothetical protein
MERCGQIAQAREASLQNRFEAGELRPVICQEAAELRRIRRAKARDLLLHPRDIWCGIDLPARAKGDTILRIEPHHFHLFAQLATARMEDLLQHTRVEEKRGAEIEAEAFRLQRRGATADVRQALVDADAAALICQQHGGGESTRPRADDHDVAFAFHARAES